MRSLARLRFPLTAFGAVALGTAAAQLAILPPYIDVQHLRLAWNLARVLIQL